MGVGQRLTRSAAYVGGVVVLDDSAAINRVLDPVYRLLGIPFDPAATGAVSDSAGVASDEFIATLTATIADGKQIVPATVSESILAAASAQRPGHDPSLLA